MELANGYFAYPVPEGHSMATLQERKLAASIAAHESWANTKDRSKRTAPARAALDQRFLDQAGGDPIRAEHLRKAYFARLALRSARARRRIRESTADLNDVAAAGGGAR